MARVLFNLILFLLPFLIYGGYVLAVRRLRPGIVRDWADAPFGWLVLVGLALGLAGVGVGAFWSGFGVEEGYTPKRLIEGNVRPGGSR